MTIYKVTIFSNVKKYVFLNGSNVSFLNELDLNPFSKSKFNLYEASSLTVSTLLHRIVLSLELGTNWDRKGWPGSEIRMYYGCPVDGTVRVSLNLSDPLYPLSDQ